MGRTILNKPTLNSTRSNQPPKPSIETLLPIATNQTTRKMSRRALLSVPRAISASVQCSVRPTFASRTPLLRPVITQPTQRRSYHEKVRNTEIAKELCLPPVKLHCSMLAEDAIKSAISNYYTKNPNARQTDLGSASASMPKIEIEKVTSTTDTGASATA